MRVSWSRDGTRVFSTSDDRTARTWRVTDRDADRGGDPGGEAAATAATGTEIRARADSVLYGHGGRVWDCQPARAGQRRLLVTAGEDCAVRLWEDTTHESPVRETPSERSLGAPTKEKQKGASRRLTTFVVDVEDTDVNADEPIWQGDKLVGFVTSGGYAHWAKKSVAIGFVPPDMIVDGADFEIEILGEKRPAKIITKPLLS